MYSIILRNANIIDGTGKEPYLADVAISGDKIAKIGNITDRGTREVDLKKEILCPGFIDMHSHSDLDIMKTNAMEHRVRQGVTTELIGQDGLSIAPLMQGREDLVKENVAPFLGKITDPWDWTDYTSYLNKIESKTLKNNVLALVGHGTIRTAVMGVANRSPVNGELDSMRQMLRDCIKAGAHGMSLGLIYPPCSYSDTSELIELAKILREHDGILVSHMRNEMDKLLESIKEMITIAEKSNVRIHISHLKAYGVDNWGKAREALDLIDQGIANGLKISFDQNPYNAGNTFLKACVPGWAYDGGEDGFQNRLRDKQLFTRIKKDTVVLFNARGGENRIVLCSIESPKYKKYEGQLFRDIAHDIGADPVDILLDMLKDSRSQALAIYFIISEDDIKTIMTHPSYTVGSDGLVGNVPHPRAYGAFPRVISKYVYEEHTLSVENAIMHMTQLPANVLQLQDRGTIKESYIADIVVFDPKTIKDMSTYQNPRLYPTGISYVLVNGQMVVDDGKYLNSCNPGMLLKKQINA